MTPTKKWSQAMDLMVDSQTGELLVRTGGGVTIKRAKIDVASADAAGNEIIAAVAGKKLCVLGMCVMAADAVSATLHSGPADTGTALSGPMPLGANGGYVIPMPADPQMHWLETGVGEALTMLLGSAVQVSGWLVYYEG